jgi:hypothetical protein
MTEQFITQEKSTIDELTEDQKADVMDLLILTVKEIREQIARDIEATIPLWRQIGWLKSRRTERAFRASAAIARGQNEELPQ